MIPSCRMLALGATLCLLSGPPIGAQEATSLPVDSMEVGGLVRTYALYSPAEAEPSPAVLLVLHGAIGDGAMIRALTERAAERLADRYGFLVVYPDGFEGAWNGCREGSPYAANRQAIDDVEFLRAIADRLEAERGADPSRAWAFGFSTGGQMALRLALEAPDEFPAVAAVAASLPTEDALDCVPSGHPASVIIVNGTADAINPFEGGEVRSERFGRIGVVRPSIETGFYFARLIGADREPGPPEDQGDSVVEQTRWLGREGREVVHLAVRDGGHEIPARSLRSSGEPGRVEGGFDAMEAAVEFFRRVTGRPNDDDRSPPSRSSGPRSPTP